MVGMKVSSEDYYCNNIMKRCVADEDPKVAKIILLKERFTCDKRTHDRLISSLTNNGSPLFSVPGHK